MIVKTNKGLLFQEEFRELGFNFYLDWRDEEQEARLFQCNKILNEGAKPGFVFFSNLNKDAYAAFVEQNPGLNYYIVEEAVDSHWNPVKDKIAVYVEKGKKVKLELDLGSFI